MSKFISIDPGKSKCGLVLVDINEKKINQAIILRTELLVEHVRNLKAREEITKVIIGNGTTSKEKIDNFQFIKKDLIVVEEKNTTYRAKERYFELFPITGLGILIPREIFIFNKNLDAVAALIILEDYCKSKFTLRNNLDTRTWLK